MTEGKKRFQLHTLVLIYLVVILAAALTWIVPGGEYDRVVKNGRTLVDPQSFKYVESHPQGLDKVLIAPIKGFGKAAEIVIFVLLIGGTFYILEKTGALTNSIKYLAIKFSSHPHLQKFFIPVTMLIFSAAGSIFGMCEETMPFVLIFIPLAISLGYDSIVGTAIPFLGAAAGFAGSTLNPFTVGIAQSIAELPLYSGLEYRIVVWVISTVSMITFVMMYASRIKKDPKKSPVYELDLARSNRIDIHNHEEVVLTKRHKIIITIFIAGIIFLVYGILSLGWFINEIAGFFLGLGILTGYIGGLRSYDIAEGFKNGAKDMMGVALIIACAKALLVVAQDGKILDSMLYNFAGVISGLHPVIGSQAMFVIQGTINFFVHSGSGQAALTMPIMAPLADVTGISRQTAVLAFQFGEGWINPILPTSGVTMGVLGLAGIQWSTWARWMLWAQIYFFILALLLLIPPFFINYH